MKPILCLDFDGVINSYESGWRGANVIPDPPVPGAIEALLAYTRHFTVCIHSSRFNVASHCPPTEKWNIKTPMEAVKDWLTIHGVSATLIVMDADRCVRDPVDGMILLCATKPSAFVTLDDRALTFNGVWPEPGTILAFVPWYKKETV